jgi:chemotaxis protein CheD
MGEIEVSNRAGDELVARGLGSCIGLALIDRFAGVAGLAHIVLPESTENDREPGKFADLAVPALIDQVVRAGASKRRLEAVLAGGARMFELGELDIGARNAEAVRSGLAASGLSVRAADTGGTRGRTMRVGVGDCTVTVKEAGGEATTLFDGSSIATKSLRWSRRPSRATFPTSLRTAPSGAASGCAPSTSRARRSSPQTISGRSPAPSTPSARRR